ncbi:hypothetical protein PR048_014534 [Dryococelus australis]|uniref:Co-chaperone HscB C-terminal oligomerisation domain-containing protein n=1 Tax=Dryococelus australis TaxID=614101 RepID=A0ABQ9HEG4_9NEOP|nr:hypothetical protein PR048_014534 [Dryococelus australis]
MFQFSVVRRDYENKIVIGIGELCLPKTTPIYGQRKHYKMIFTPSISEVLEGHPDDFRVADNVLMSRYDKKIISLHMTFVKTVSEEKRISEEYSSLLNKAYATLTDPLKRAIYMLELRNVFIQEDSIQSPEFLLEIMEKNEELVETEDADNLKTFDKKNKLVLEQLSRQVSLAIPPQCIQHKNDFSEGYTKKTKMTIMHKVQEQLACRK